MKKRLFKNEPNRGDRGHYVFFDNNATNFNDSNSVAINLFDKFDKRDLYTKIIQDSVNDTIIRNQLVPIGRSFFQFQEINIVNSGVKHNIVNSKVEVAIFDKSRYEKQIQEMTRLVENNPNLTTSIPTNADGLNAILSINAQYYNEKFLQTQKDIIFDIDSTDPMEAGFLTLIAGIFPHRFYKFYSTTPQNFIYDKNQTTATFWSDPITGANITIEKPGTPGEDDEFDVKDLRVFNSDSRKVKSKKNFGKILEKQTIMEFLGVDEPNIITFENDGNFNPYNSFDINENNDGFGNGWLGGELQLDGSPIMFDEGGFQDIYVAVFMQGDALRWWGTDPRKKRIQVFKFSSDELFTEDGSGKTTEINFKYGDSNRRSGRGGKGTAWIFGGIGGAEKPAFKVESLKLKIDTSTGFQNPANIDEEAVALADSVQPAKEFDDLTIEEDFLLQNNYQSIENFNLSLMGVNYTGDEFLEMKENFEPISIINPLNFDVDLQSFQVDVEQRRISSAPNQISLDFQICDYEDVDSDLIPRDTSTYDDIRGYKFYVVSWDDVDNRFKTPDDYFNDIPSNVVDLKLKQIEEDLYKFSDIGTPLIHGYSSSGIKTIKGVVFSYTKTGKKQIVRWKFFESKFFLDLPLTRYPDFVELGGADYTTIPYPFTTPVIGGVAEKSNYSKSLKNTINSGNISEDELVTERILLESFNNDELGESILEFDLEQIRYFDEPYSIYDLLDIDIVTQELNTTPEYLSTLPPPQYFEEFDIRNDGNIDILDVTDWINVGRTDIATYINDNIVDGAFAIQLENGNGLEQPITNFFNPTNIPFIKYDNQNYYDGETNKFPEESSVGQIFINDNQDVDLKRSCKFELNTGELVGKSIYDSIGNSNKGLLFGDYKLKKTQKNSAVTRDSSIILPIKSSNKNGAL